MQSSQGSKTTQELFSVENSLHTVLGFTCMFYVIQIWNEISSCSVGWEMDSGEGILFLDTYI